LVIKEADAENFTVHDMKTGDRVLDEIKIKVDNTNKRYLFTALYYQQRRGNIEGLYTVVWDTDSSGILGEHTLPFDEEMRAKAKGRDDNLKIAFNDYFIEDIVIRKDGGYLL